MPAISPDRERPEFMHRAASGDQEVEREVLRLLRLDSGAEEWLSAKKPPSQIVHAATELHAFYPGQVLGARRALPIIRQIVAGLYAAHQAGVVHRDLKCANVMIVPREEGPPQAVVMDFGLAREASKDGGTSRSMSTRPLSSVGGFGTLAYMGPGAD